jgi:hypothetical protein
MVGSTDLKVDTLLSTGIYLVRAGVLIQKLQKTGKITTIAGNLRL